MSESQNPDMNPETVSHVYFMDESSVTHKEGRFKFLRDGGHFEMVFTAEQVDGRDNLETLADRLDIETTVLALNESYPVGYGTLDANDIIEGKLNVRVDSARCVSPRQAEQMRSGSEK